MDPKRAARRLATLGYLLLLLAFALRGLSLGLTIDASRSAFAPPPGGLVVPAVGHYTLSADGKQILFEQQNADGQQASWFSIPVEGGLPAPAQPPEENIKPFTLRDGRLNLFVGNGSSLASGSPADMTIGIYAASPDGKRMAFGAFRPGRDWGLFILTDQGQLSWLGDFPQLGDLNWSPESQRLAFVAPAENVEQVFTIDSGGQNLRQVTSDPGRKSEPRWSPDGQKIAYLFTLVADPLTVSQAAPTAELLFPPTPSPYQSTYQPDTVSVEIGLVNADGSNFQEVQRIPSPKYNLRWISTTQGVWLAYAERLPFQPQMVNLYAIDPLSSRQQRLYPPLALDSLKCPASLPVGSEGQVQASVSNSALLTLDAPLLMRSGPHAFAVNGPRDTGQLRAQSLAIPAGESSTSTWPVRTAGGLATHVSMLINLKEPSLVSEQHCVILNTTTLGLPNIHFLALMLPLTVLGMLLCLPWLRHQRSAWLWAAWAAAPLLSVLMIAIECAWIYRAMG